MSEPILYLSAGDIAGLAITPGEARRAVLDAFADYAAGNTQSLPKSSLSPGPGRLFQAMIAASRGLGVAVLKWVTVVPIPASGAGRSVNSLIAVSDHANGAMRAVMDGDIITLLRTAAMSAAAASRLAPPMPRTIGLVGCGLQAHAHLDAFLDLFPGLATVLVFSRSPASAARLGAAARARGLQTKTLDDADDLLAESDLVISTIPGAPGLRPFLDARRMRPAAYAAAVDTGRSWLPPSFPAFDLLATDSLEQSHAPYDVDGEPVRTASFTTDLAALATAAPGSGGGGRTLFCFKGFALGDLALAALALDRARAAGVGQMLPR